MYRCVMIVYQNGLPKGDNPIAAIGLFGFPVTLLLFLASMLMFSAGFGILLKRKGATPNAALAGKIIVGFAVFSIVVVGGLFAWNNFKAKPEEAPAETKVASIKDYLTKEFVVQVILTCGVGMIIPMLVWSWAATQGRRWDWELPEPAHKLRLKPLPKVGGPQPPPEKK
jgi:hypothetical protein